MPCFPKSIANLLMLNRWLVGLNFNPKVTSDFSQDMTVYPKVKAKHLLVRNI
jgi:hypothetical protein